MIYIAENKEQVVVTVNDVYGEVLGHLAEEERQVMYDVIQAMILAHDLYVSDNNIAAKKVNKDLTEKQALDESNIFGYWFYTSLFSVLSWRVGFDQAARVGYSSLAGTLNQAINGTNTDWAEFAQNIAKNREMSETITDFLFGFKGADDVSETPI